MVGDQKLNSETEYDLYIYNTPWLFYVIVVTITTTTTAAIMAAILWPLT